MTVKHDKKFGKVVSVNFRGEDFDVSADAMRSMRVQRKIARARHDGDDWAMYEAVDEVCMGNLDAYAERMPAADGDVSPMGGTVDDFGEFMTAAAEAVKAGN